MTNETSELQEIKELLQKILGLQMAAAPKQVIDDFKRKEERKRQMEYRWKQRKEEQKREELKNAEEQVVIPLDQNTLKGVGE